MNKFKRTEFKIVANDCALKVGIFFGKIVFMKKALCLKVVLCLSVMQTVSAAEIEYLLFRSGDNTHVAYFQGAIREGDSKRLAEIYESLPKTAQLEVILNSPGGSVREALKIGDYLDEHEISVLIPKPMRCFSSCVFILAGADYKRVEGHVGIHRPYFADTSMREDEIEAGMPKLQELVRGYLVKKMIPAVLAEDMFSIPPERMKLLVKDEITKYRLDQRNYVKEEKSDLENARQLGISRGEYLVRKKRLTDECTKYGADTVGMKKCINQVMYP